MQFGAAAQGAQGKTRAHGPDPKSNPPLRPSISRRNKKGQPALVYKHLDRVSDINYGQSNQTNDISF
jgi:hypothetical protein